MSSGDGWEWAGSEARASLAKDSAGGSGAGSSSGMMMWKRRGWDGDEVGMGGR